MQTSEGDGEPASAIRAEERGERRRLEIGRILVGARYLSADLRARPLARDLMAPGATPMHSECHCVFSNNNNNNNPNLNNNNKAACERAIMRAGARGRPIGIRPRSLSSDSRSQIRDSRSRPAAPKRTIRTHLASREPALARSIRAPNASSALRLQCRLARLCG